MNNARLDDVPVSPKLREMLVKLLPDQITRTVAAARLLHSQNRVALTRDACSELLGRAADKKERGQLVARVHAELLKAGFNVELQNGGTTHHARFVQVLYFEHVPDDVLAAVRADLDTWWENRQSLVMLVSGKRFDKRGAAAYRAAQDARVAGHLPLIEKRFQFLGQIASYLLDQPRKSLLIAESAFAEAISKIDEDHPDTEDKRSLEKRRQILRALRVIWMCGGKEPFLPSRRGKVERVYARGWSQLPAEYRLVLRPRCVVADFSAAHPRIGAALWGAKDALSFLQRADSCDTTPFDLLAKEVIGDEHPVLVRYRIRSTVRKLIKIEMHASNCGRNPAVAIKVLRRSLTEGIEQALSRSDLNVEEVVDWLVTRYFAHPFVVSMAEARDRRVAQVSAARKLITRGGLEIPIRPTFAAGKSDHQAHKEFFHQINSAVSAELIETEAEIKFRAIYGYANETGGSDNAEVRVLGDEHDGVTLYVRRNDEHHLQQLRDRAAAVSRELIGVEMQLKFESARDDEKFLADCDLVQQSVRPHRSVPAIRAAA